MGGSHRKMADWVMADPTPTPKADWVMAEPTPSQHGSPVRGQSNRSSKSESERSPRSSYDDAALDPDSPSKGCTAPSKGSPSQYTAREVTQTDGSTFFRM